MVIADEDGLTDVALLTELDGRTLYVETGEIDGQLREKVRGLGVAIAHAQTA